MSFPESSMFDPAKTPQMKTERESGSFQGSSPAANAKRKKRKRSGIVFLLLGLFAIFSFISIAGKAGSDPSGALIFFISAPLAVLGGICTLVGIFMILLGSGSNDSRSSKQNAEALDSDSEKDEEDGEHDHNSADLGARHFVKQTTSWAAAYVVGPLVVLPLLFYLTFQVFGRQLAEFFFR